MGRKLKSLGRKKLKNDSLLKLAQEVTAKRKGNLQDDYTLPPAIENTLEHPNLTNLSKQRAYTGYEGLEASVKRRAEVFNRCATDTKYRQECWERSKTDINYWTNTFCWTYDPRVDPRTLPFDLFPKQEEYLIWAYERMANKESGLVEKSRDMGLTWLSCIIAVHQWLFFENSKVTIGSRKEMLVDRLGDPDSIFEKIRMLIRFLPSWMTPKNYVDAYMRILNKDNNSAITGEAGKQLGRGGRAGLCLVDEFAFVESAEVVDAALSQTTDCVFYISTPNGQNAFYRKRMSGKLPVFRFHWRQDPRKDEDWYAKMVEKLEPHIVAQEIDIDYSASVLGLVIPAAWVSSAIEFQLWGADGDAIAGLDVADEGNCYNVLVIRKGIRVIHVEAWNQTDTAETAMKAKTICEQHGVKTLYYDSIGVGAGVGGTLKKLDYVGFNFIALGNAAAIDRCWPEFNNRNGKDIFVNARAERWWSLRMRFEKTARYQKNFMEKGELEDIDWNELISIPDHEHLVPQLSWPKWDHNDSGKIRIEGKKDMAKRGIPSPDYADALSYAFTPKDPGADWLLGFSK